VAGFFREHGRTFKADEAKHGDDQRRPDASRQQLGRRQRGEADLPVSRIQQPGHRQRDNHQDLGTE